MPGKEEHALLESGQREKVLHCKDRFGNLEGRGDQELE